MVVKTEVKQFQLQSDINVTGQLFDNVEKWTYPIPKLHINQRHDVILNGFTA